MKANKALGQHFLKDQTVIDKICSDFSDSAQSIIEIGPGPGVLTRELACLKLPFCAIEKDSRFEDIISPLANLTMIDALKIDFDSFISEHSLKKVWLVSNLPYNIASPLLINFLKSSSIEYMTLMFQKEVGQKLIAKEMSSIKFLCNNFFECSLLKRVQPGAFNPPPKVDSIVISFKKKDNPTIPVEDFAIFDSYMRKLFSGKRKQLGTTLKMFHNPEEVQDLLNRCNIDTKIRAQAMSEEQIYQLYGEMKLWEKK